jgi:N-acetylmuramoyl-L-alanine amidase
VRITAFTLIAALGITPLAAAQPDLPALEARTAEALRAAFAADGAYSAPALALQAVSLTGSRLTVSLARDLLPFAPDSSEFERFSRRLHVAVADVLRAEFEAFEIVTLLDGQPLDQKLAATPPLAVVPFQTQAAPPLSPSGTPVRARSLAARRIAVSPGHGYYLNGNAWVLQRGFWQGIVEDFVNHDMITVLSRSLADAGADVRPTRNLDRAAGPGVSGFPRWQEAARYHVQALGADPTVWNEPGFTHLEQDIRSRPRYANAVNADILVSLHNNGGGGTGTETLYDTNNGFGPESRRLADLVHARVIGAIRREYNAAWADRRVQGFNGSYGENRLATRPSILLEIAFMDRPLPDNAALQDEAFHRLVAAAIQDGIQEYFDGPAAVVPIAPSNLQASTGPAAVTLTWTDAAANETGFRVERKSSGTGPWDLRATVSANSGPAPVTFVDPAVAAGNTYVYRVVAVNAAGASRQFSNEAAATVAPAPGATPGAPRGGAWLANVSLRTTLPAGRSVTVGFVVNAGRRDVVVRAAGPTLAPFGLVSAMADPRLELFRGGTKVAENNDWPAALAPTLTALGAFPFPAASRDAALQFPFDGAYTVQATGTTAGVVLIEGYDAGTGGEARLVNLSARNRVGTGADILIAGFFIAGTGTQRVLIRAVGPTLMTLGVDGALSDPKLEVFDAAGGRLAESDNWDPALAATFAQVAAFPLPAGSRDSALVLTLPAGRGYTAQVSGVNNATGEALVEVYELP